MIFLLNVMAATEDASVASVGEMDFSGLFIKMVILLLLIVLLGFLLLKFVGRTNPWVAKGGANHFELVSWHRLDQKKSVYVVRIGKRVFALGGSEHSVNLISELNPSDLIDEA